MTELSLQEKECSSYYKEVRDSLHIEMDWLVKLPFHTVRWAYFQITRRYAYLPEDKNKEAMTRFENWFKVTIFDENGKPRPYKKGGDES